jgi:flagellar hook-length control protein FliK
VAAATPVPGDPVPETDNLTRLIEAMRVTAKTGGWEATVRLKPQHLGEVTIALRVDGDTVSATVNAEIAGVRQWLRSQEEAVRSGMAEHGLTLDRFHVQRDGQRSRRDAQQRDQPSYPRPRRAPESGTERFEVVA